jgi:hypothetical protein
MDFRTLVDSNCPANITYLFDSGEIYDLFEIIEIDTNDVISHSLSELQTDNLESIIIENYENGATIRVSISGDPIDPLLLSTDKIMEKFGYLDIDESFGYALYKMCDYYLLVAGTVISVSESTEN